MMACTSFDIVKTADAATPRNDFKKQLQIIATTIITRKIYRPAPENPQIHTSPPTASSPKCRQATDNARKNTSNKNHQK
jgi:hypothetical protein